VEVKYHAHRYASVGSSSSPEKLISKSSHCVRTIMLCTRSALSTFSTARSYMFNPTARSISRKGLSFAPCRLRELRDREIVWTSDRSVRELRAENQVKHSSHDTANLSRFPVRRCISAPISMLTQITDLKVAFQTGVITDHWRFGHIWLMIVKMRGTLILNCHVTFERCGSRRKLNCPTSVLYACGNSAYRILQAAR
jgi:hypothetical protein